MKDSGFLFFISFKNLFTPFKPCVCVCLCVPVHVSCWYQRGLEEGIRSSGSGVTGGRELPCVGAGS